MKRSLPKNSKWAERRSTLVYAVRAATFGSWRMLTLGAEYEDTWAPSPDKKQRAGQQGEEGDDPAEETEIYGEDTDGPSWRAADTSTLQYDTVLHLDGLSKDRKKDGVSQIVKNHDLLNNLPWPGRCHFNKIHSKFSPVQFPQ